MRVLITGITGMTGSHLAEYFLNQGGFEVYGSYRRRSPRLNLEDLERSGRINYVEAGVSDVKVIKKAVDKGKVNMINADLYDAFSVRKLIAATEPEYIFHLAAQSYVPGSWNAPAETLQTNIISELNVFEALRDMGLSPVIQIAGSSEEYGLVRPDEVPIKETNPLRPLSPYAVSKVGQEMLAYQYFRSYGLKTITTRGFNHEGPRRGDNFVTSSFAKQIALIEAGKQEPVIHVGDLNSKRDWTDVRDICRAYHLLVEKCEPGEVYNIGTGVSRSIREMLDLLLTMTSIQVEVRQDPARLRPSDVPLLWADASKFKAATGWEPEIPFEQTMRDLLNYWRAHVL
ncbi:MAG: GDP-mannose 4,6-dehydratase [Candidatus Chloroheliales bacterium]|nr:MAG: GDP-mannose 4,6-dehydratase [Chloroflexota bacterium]